MEHTDVQVDALLIIAVRKIVILLTKIYFVRTKRPMTMTLLKRMTMKRRLMMIFAHTHRYRCRKLRNNYCFYQNLYILQLL